MEETLEQQRVRMKFSTNAKGFAQLEITCEFPTVEESAAAMDNAIKSLRKVLADNKRAEAGTV